MDPGDTPGVLCPAPVQVLPHFGEEKILFIIKLQQCPDLLAKASGIAGWEELEWGSSCFGDY